jgi:thiamine-monophosphate kinase
LLGGDTTATPGPLTIAITAFGSAPRFVSRAGARPGDGVYVSGAIGDAALGLRLRQDPTLGAALSTVERDALLNRYLLPNPRLDLVETLPAGASAAMDVSDGLAGDLAKLTRASGVSAQVEVAHVPLSAAGQVLIAHRPALLETALTGGDDYEILFTAGPGFAPPPGVVRIGEIVAGAAAPVFSGWPASAQKPTKLSYSHF